MNRLIVFVALVIATSICLTVKAPAVGAQSCDVTPAPDCPYGYYDLLPTLALLSATTARNGFPTPSSWAPVRGSKALTNSTAP